VCEEQTVLVEFEEGRSQRFDVPRRYEQARPADDVPDAGQVRGHQGAPGSHALEERDAERLEAGDGRERHDVVALVHVVEVGVVERTREDDVAGFALARHPAQSRLLAPAPDEGDLEAGDSRRRGDEAVHSLVRAHLPDAEDPERAALPRAWCRGERGRVDPPRDDLCGPAPPARVSSAGALEEARVGVGRHDDPVRQAGETAVERVVETARGLQARELDGAVVRVDEGWPAAAGEEAPEDEEGVAQRGDGTVEVDDVVGAEALREAAPAQDEGAHPPFAEVPVRHVREREDVDVVASGAQALGDTPHTPGDPGDDRRGLRRHQEHPHCWNVWREPPCVVS
jgi:hypothetical protein